MKYFTAQSEGSRSEGFGNAHGLPIRTTDMNGKTRELMASLGQLETFLHGARDSVPLLIRCGLAHAQFETIHPFLDGNGRMGRLLITLMLCEQGILAKKPPGRDWFVNTNGMTMVFAPVVASSTGTP